MFHLTCYGWLIFRARSAAQLATMLAAACSSDFASGQRRRRRPCCCRSLLYTTPLLARPCLEAWFDDVLVVPRLPIGVRYSVYAATFYLTMLFGNFGGADFIYFQF